MASTRQTNPCRKNSMKPIVAVKQMDILLRRRYLDNTQFYFTNREHAKPKNKLLKMDCFGVPVNHCLLPYRSYKNDKEENMRVEYLAKPVHRKDNVKTAVARDISERLYIPEPADDVRCIDGIHKEFYSVIEGRPVRSHNDIVVFKQNINNYIKTRQQIGYRRDLVLKIDIDMATEQKEYEKISSNLTEYIKNFRKFLHEDNLKANKLVAKAEKIHEKLEAKITELLGYLDHITYLNNSIFDLDSIRRILKTYRHFFLFIAPLYWREYYDESYERTDFSIEKEQFVSKSPEYGKVKSDVGLYQIDAILEAAKTELQKPAPAHMYFQTPEELLLEFHKMEIQCRDYFVEVSKSRAPHILLQRCIKDLRLSMKYESECSLDYTAVLNTQIEQMLFNEQFMREKFMRILTKSFYDTIASPFSLKLKVCIEYVYERIFGKSEEGHTSIMDPAKALENLYEKYSLMMDGLDINIIKKARKELFEQDRRMMTAAYKAQRELKMFAEMNKSLDIAFLPPAKYTRPVLTKFIPQKELLRIKNEEKKKLLIAQGYRIEKKPIRVSPEDRENLTYFTSWCEGENPKPYLKFIEEFVKPVFIKNKNKVLK